MAIIEARKISYIYPNMRESESGRKAADAVPSLRNGLNAETLDTLFALREVSFNVSEGEFIAVIGANGSGKSTLARHLNALLTPTEGSIYIDGKDSRTESDIAAIRRLVGMVFQNPDNQIVGAVVDEDVAFGPENLGVEHAQMANDVAWALSSAGIEDLADKSPNYLSGGQKQKVAIAGALAMRPKCLVLDEATSMLDPESRRDIMKVIRMLNTEMTVIMITHNMDEAAEADRVFVMSGGRIAMDGRPAEIFKDEAKLKSLGLVLPSVCQLANRMRKAGYNIPDDVLTAASLCGCLNI